MHGEGGGGCGGDGFLCPSVSRLLPRRLLRCQVSGECAVLLQALGGGYANLGLTWCPGLTPATNGVT